MPSERPRLRLLGSALAVLVIAAWSTRCSSPESARPNIVVILLDTMRADYFSFMGFERETAPYIAELAKQSVVFEKAYSTSSWTAPATASLLTGVYPDRHGVTRGFLVQIKEASVAAGEGVGVAAEEIKLTRLSRTTPSLPELLKEEGYTTFGLASNVNIGPEIGFDRGFDRFERHDEASAEEIHDRLLEWKPAIRSAAPFFLYLHLNDVHKPYYKYEEWYEERGGVTEAEHYESEIGYMDRWIGKMLDELALEDDTLIAIVSDHGEEFMERGNIGHKMSLHNEVNQIVMLFHGPGLGIAPGREALPVSGIDFAPTLMEFAGLAPDPESVDGVSLRPLVASGASELVRESLREHLSERAIVAHRRGPEDFNMYAVIRDDWKLVQSPFGEVLFDMARDPGELKNMFDVAPARRAELTAALDRYRARGYDIDSTEADVPWDEELVDKLRVLGYVED